ncbi:PREDICTED: uncharacterized protein LOC105807320 [Propithecus coquereli]|uniref:uncharacterized protein LOC105807320 n=1 Tax=Propithecus coquereli TaxID=379532 RepID=UPI00063EF948|nr:PREDICTED: uncharacterized protein LOC105807320 [Propithecus coquereli]
MTVSSVQRGPFTRAPLLPSPHLFETWQGAEPSRSAVKRQRRQRRRQRRRRDRNTPPAASPASQRCGGTPGESLQTSSGRGEDAGSPSGRARERAGGSPSSGVPSLPVPPLPQGWPPQLVGARARRGAVALGGRLAFAPGAPGWRVARLSLLAFPSPAASCLGSFLAGITTSSPPLPQVTARARAAAAPRHFPGPGGGALLCGRFSAEPFKLSRSS